MKELLGYEMGPFGEKGFPEFMAAMYARTNEDTGEIDINDEDIGTINKYREKGHNRILDRVFNRPINDATRRFRGQ